MIGLQALRQPAVEPRYSERFGHRQRELEAGFPKGRELVDGAVRVGQRIVVRLHRPILRQALRESAQ